MQYGEQLKGSTIRAFPGKHNNFSPAPPARDTFIKLASEEMDSVRSVQRGLLAHHTLLEDHHVFSDDYRKEERQNTWTGVNQLEDIHKEFVRLVASVSMLPSAQSAVPAPMKVDLDYARSIAAMWRGVSWDNHVFTKVNWSLDMSKTGAVALTRLWIPAIDYYLSKDKDLWDTDEAILRKNPRLLGFKEFQDNIWDFSETPPVRWEEMEVEQSAVFQKDKDKVGER